MKTVLASILTILEEIAMNSAAMEAALINRDLLDDGELDAYIPAEQESVQKRLYVVRHLLSSLPD